MYKSNYLNIYIDLFGELNWCTLYLVFNNINHSQDINFNYSDLLRFAEIKLKNDLENKQILNLVLIDPSEKQKIEQTLLELSESTKVILEKEVLRIRATLLYSTINNLDGDYLNKIIEIGEFWSRFNHPKDAPLYSGSKSSDYNEELFYKILRAQKRMA